MDITKWRAGDYLRATKDTTAIRIGDVVVLTRIIHHRTVNDIEVRLKNGDIYRADSDNFEYLDQDIRLKEKKIKLFLDESLNVDFLIESILGKERKGVSASVSIDNKNISGAILRVNQHELDNFKKYADRNRVGKNEVIRIKAKIRGSRLCWISALYIKKDSSLQYDGGYETFWSLRPELQFAVRATPSIADQTDPPTQSTVGWDTSF